MLISLLDFEVNFWEMLGIQNWASRISQVNEKKDNEELKKQFP